MPVSPLIIAEGAQAAGGGTLIVDGLVEVAAPTEYAITTAEAKAHMRIEISDDDALIGAQIGAATQWAQNYCDRQFVQATYRQYADSFPTEFVIRRPSLLSVSAIKYIDTNGTLQTLASSQYQVTSVEEPARIWPAYGVTWPSVRSQPEAVYVEFVAGYGAASAVPKSIKQALLLLVAHMYEFREPILTGTIVNEIPLAVNALLDMSRHGRVF